ncbi:MAG: prepilin-type N-terminal cleavage/methylation domain-containing protein [Gammaproteobacteria bacterium]|nr:prepilin-type N-terminal cleavage/methylation domain-containing protein [Gammaproteobacteria bacterium]
MTRGIHHNRGFSLLEVLVAFSIFAISLGVLFQIYHKGTQSAILSDEYTRAILIAQSKMASAGIEDDFEIGEYNSVESDLYSWVTRVRPYSDGQNLNSNTNMTVREIEVTVYWDSLGRSRSVKLSTLKLIPMI